MLTLLVCFRRGARSPLRFEGSQQVWTHSATLVGGALRRKLAYITIYHRTQGFQRWVFCVASLAQLFSLKMKGIRFKFMNHQNLNG